MDVQDRSYHIIHERIIYPIVLSLQPHIMSKPKFKSKKVFILRVVNTKFFLRNVKYCRTMCYPTNTRKSNMARGIVGFTTPQSPGSIRDLRPLGVQPGLGVGILVPNWVQSTLDIKVFTARRGFSLSKLSWTRKNTIEQSKGFWISFPYQKAQIRNWQNHSILLITW